PSFPTRRSSDLALSNRRADRASTKSRRIRHALLPSASRRSPHVVCSLSRGRHGDSTRRWESDLTAGAEVADLDAKRALPRFGERARSAKFSQRNRAWTEAHIARRNRTPVP